MGKKRQKDALHAANNWQKAQLKAAALVQEIEKSASVIEEYKHELDELTLTGVEENIKLRRKDVEQFLMGARDRYVDEINRIGEEYFKDIDKAIKSRLGE